MDMNEEEVSDENAALDILPRPPPAHLSNGAASSSSILLSPLSQPRLTPTFDQTSYLHQCRHHRPLLSLESTWPGVSDSLNLLATAARMRSSSDEEEEPVPLSLRETLGHSEISAISAASAIAASRAVSHRRRGLHLPYFRYFSDPTM